MLTASSPPTWAQGPAIAHAGSNTMFYAVVEAEPARQLAFFAATDAGAGDDVTQRALATPRERVLEQ